MLAAARCIAVSIALLLVASPLVWKTTTLGARAPAPSAFSVRWLASYAGLPGTERLWYQRVDTFPAAKPPKIVRMSQRPITGQRCREVRCARRVSMGISCSQRSGSSTEDRIRGTRSADHWPQGDGRATKVGLSIDFGRLVSRGTRA